MAKKTYSVVLIHRSRGLQSCLAAYWRACQWIEVICKGEFYEKAELANADDDAQPADQCN